MYVNNLTKIYVSRVFIHPLPGGVFHRNFWSFLWRRLVELVSIEKGTNDGARKVTETYVIEFCYGNEKL